ncbi:MAG: 1-deoxy-D-xylulose-5-phosphate reductoisomerase [Planctomycetes bacterium]|nr:1-deoxy-D-xylulose-5-phosphate reductoisomerase [Planctomycetota bacterium]MBI3833549.1 1-deoxy-D-xylulose-5-phosphate reductoisomerase [Planctomycetota bacterium]
MKNRVMILGSTGSIGTSALDVLAHLGSDWEVVGLAAGSNAKKLAEQANRCRPEAVALVEPGSETTFRSAIGYAPRVHIGPDALSQLVDSVDFDCAVCAVVGAAGVKATLRCVELGKRIALANKEALVVAGSILMPLARKSGATVIPVDSEHSAIFQALHAGRKEDVAKVHLTSSGGPFRTWSSEAMEEATAEDALRHPVWDMGPKITIDSATMMNKAMEIVEARWLFDLHPEQIDVILHPECIVHSLVEFRDGSMIAQLGSPDMRGPIQYALTYPQRKTSPASRVDLCAIRQLSFQRPDVERFPALRIGYDVARQGGTLGAVFNAANEAAVGLFRDGVIGFRDIARYVERVIRDHVRNDAPTLEDLLTADKWARHEVAKCTVC